MPIILPYNIQYDEEVIIIGDDLQDIYNYGHFADSQSDHYDKRWITSHQVIKNGGARYVYDNYRIHSKNSSSVFITSISPSPVIRYVDTLAKCSYFIPAISNAISPYYSQHITFPNAIGFVISDYNKGFLSDFSTNILSLPSLKWMIVDSKYLSLQYTFKRFFDSAFSILKINKAEVSSEYLDTMNFDCVILTDGPNPIEISFCDEKFIIPVPAIEPISPCGAGDVFVSVLASLLYSKVTPDMTHNQILACVLHSIPECIHFAQQVCLHPVTEPITL